jgi:glycosyltransferase involved in cell wall biosynthesis
MPVQSDQHATRRKWCLGATPAALSERGSGLWYNDVTFSSRASTFGLMVISIVTPAYNAAKFLGDTIESVLAQTLGDWEYWIIDDGSSDHTFDIAMAYAAKDPRIHVLRQENAGTAMARNAGCARTDPTAPYVIFLDHDDVWKPQALQTLHDALAANPGAVGAHGMRRHVDQAGSPVGAPGGTIMNWERRKMSGDHIVVMNRTEPTTFATLICDCCITTTGVVLLRRSAWNEIKRRPDADAFDMYFDPVVAPADDWDAWLRLSLRGDFVFVDEVVLDWRQHGSNQSADENVTYASETKLRRKMASWPELDLSQRRMADARLRRTHASLERHNARTCWRWAVESLGRGEGGHAARFAVAWWRRYLSYVDLKLSWSDRQAARPIPTRLVDPRQLFDG